MKRSLILFFCTPIIYLLPANSLFAQSWQFVKEKDGIKVYTRTEPDNSLKSFKGEATLNAPADKVCSLIMNPGYCDWWGYNFTQRELLDYKEDKFVQYYLVYGLPWPLTKRDFVVETTITKDSLTGENTMISKPLLNKVPVKPNLIRISKYSQKWIIQPLENQKVHVVLEGFIDPGGNLPDWLYNVVIPETPFKTIRSLREKLKSGRSVQLSE